MAVRGRLIVFEGGEASGKSTQAVLLADAVGALLTREPGGTPLGEALRPLVLDQSFGPVDPRSELLMMVAARAEHVAKVIRPALESGRHVVCDRYSGSTIAYQGYGRGLPLEDVLVACELATNGCDPDLNVLLDVDAVTARTRKGDPEDAIEAAGAAFHGRVREGFLALAAADPDRWVVIDAAMTREHVTEAVREAVGSHFSELGR